ncbi:MAG: DUF4412 domain-containing protein [Chthoniobacterales bacterium]
MKTIFSFFVLVLSASCAFAGIQVSQRVQVDGSNKMDTVITTMLEGDKMRVDMGEETSSIIDSKTGDVITLMHSQKMAMTLPKETIDIAKQSAKAMTGDLGKKSVSYKKTGQTEKINGFDCEEIIATMTDENGKEDQSATMWIASNAPLSDEMKKMFNNIGDQFGGLPSNSEAAIQELNGFPIRMIYKNPDGSITTITTLSIAEKDIPADSFEVPKSYRGMNLPGKLLEMMKTQ